MEEFDEEFPNERGIFENNDPYNSRRKAVKQFISDLRKRDMEALIGMIKKQEKNQEIFWGNGQDIITKLIKDYYEN